MASKLTSEFERARKRSDGKKSKVVSIKKRKEIVENHDRTPLIEKRKLKESRTKEIMAQHRYLFFFYTLTAIAS